MQVPLIPNLKVVENERSYRLSLSTVTRPEFGL